METKVSMKEGGFLGEEGQGGSDNNNLRKKKT